MNTTDSLPQTAEELGILASADCMPATGMTPGREPDALGIAHLTRADLITRGTLAERLRNNGWPDEQFDELGEPVPMTRRKAAEALAA